MSSQDNVIKSAQKAVKEKDARIKQLAENEERRDNELKRITEREEKKDFQIKQLEAEVESGKMSSQSKSPEVEELEFMLLTLQEDLNDARNDSEEAQSRIMKDKEDLAMQLSDLRARAALCDTCSEEKAFFFGILEC